MKSSGPLLMSLGALLLPIVDGAAKHLGTSHSPWMIGWARYAVAAVLLCPVLVRRSTRARLACGLRGHLWRTLLLTSAMTCYFAALREIPMVTAVTAYFIGPIIAVALGVLVLGEPVTRAKVWCTAGGMAGAVLVVGPIGDLDPGVLLALAAGTLYACYLVAIRASGRRDEVRQESPFVALALQCVLATLLLAPPAVTHWSAPAPQDLWVFAVLGLVSVVCQYLVIASLRRSDASTLAPLVYLELVGAAVVGLVVFGEVPTTRTLLGAAIIVVAGLSLTRGPSTSTRPTGEACPTTP